MKNCCPPEPLLFRAFHVLLLFSVTGLTACSTMRATDTGFLKNRGETANSRDGSAAYFRSPTLIDLHQARSISVEWAMPVNAAAELATLLRGKS
jgi:hypothetical protein